MRQKQGHQCRYCGKPTEHFRRVRAKVNMVKVFKCDPECNASVWHRRCMVDCSRMEQRLARQLSQSSPWLQILGETMK